MSDAASDPAQDADCFWFPNLPKCKAIVEEQAESEEVVPAGPVEQPEQSADSELLLPIMGQIAYLSVALIAASAHYMQMFRWRKDTAAGQSYYITWTTYESVLGTNYWKLADQVLNYGGLVIWGVAAISQIMSFFALQDINLKVWEYLVTYGSTLVGLIYNVFMLLAVQTTSGKSTNANVVQDATIGGLMLAINGEWLRTNAALAFAGSILWGASRNWLSFQMDAIEAAKAADGDEQAADGAGEDQQEEENAEDADGQDEDSIAL